MSTPTSTGFWYGCAQRDSESDRKGKDGKLHDRSRDSGRKLETSENWKDESAVRGAWWKCRRDGRYALKAISRESLIPAHALRWYGKHVNLPLLMKLLNGALWSAPRNAALFCLILHACGVALHMLQCAAQTQQTHVQSYLWYRRLGTALRGLCNHVVYRSPKINEHATHDNCEVSLIT